MRNESAIKDANYDDIIRMAEGAKGKDTFGYRAEFINLVRLAQQAAALQALYTPAPPAPTLRGPTMNCID